MKRLMMLMVLVVGMMASTQAQKKYNISYCLMTDSTQQNADGSPIWTPEGKVTVIQENATIKFESDDLEGSSLHGAWTLFNTETIKDAELSYYGWGNQQLMVTRRDSIGLIIIALGYAGVPVEILWKLEEIKE